VRVATSSLAVDQPRAGLKFGIGQNQPQVANRKLDQLFNEIKIERIVPEKERRFPWGLICAFAIGLVIVGGAGLLAYTQMQKDVEQTKQVVERSFNKLKIPVDEFDQEQLKKLAPIVREYTADYCDPRSKLALLEQVSSAGFVRLAAKLADDHYGSCAKKPEFLVWSFTYNQQLGEYSKALEIINRLIEFDPANAQFRFDRGRLYEDTNRFEKALMDYISTLDLLGKPQEVAGTQFYYISVMYEKLGRYCEAATPLETYISYDFVKRHDPQIDRLINEYRSKGNCKRSMSGDVSSVRVRKSGAVLLVEATLNNVAGLFVLDTGASLVSVTRSFANRARIVPGMEDKITLQTANGLADGLLATASSVQVGNAYSTFVPVVVIDDAKLAADDNVVGLLGMSFLSRFDMKFGKDTVELRSR
jgi:aspartyl protease family protein